MIFMRCRNVRRCIARASDVFEKEGQYCVWISYDLSGNPQHYHQKSIRFHADFAPLVETAKKHNKCLEFIFSNTYDLTNPAISVADVPIYNSFSPDTAEAVIGKIESIHVAQAAGGAMRAVESATLLPGRGIDGDRYANQEGTYSDWPKDHQLTLVEAEVAEEFGFAPGETRRNILTRGIRLNALVGKRFRVGGALCEGTRLCEPCGYLEKTTNRPGLVAKMAGRGGLRAIILEGATVVPGDTITPVEAA